MRALTLLCCAAATSAAGTVEIAAGALSISLDKTSGALSLSVGGTQWFDGGMTVMRNGTKYYNSVANDTAHTLPLKLQDVTTGAAGSDALGAYGPTTSVEWNGGGKRMVVTYRPYPALGAVVVRQSFPDGLSTDDPNHNKLEQVVSSALTLTRSHVDLRALIYQGTQLQNTQIIKWSKGDSLSLPEKQSTDPPYSGSPFVAYDAKLGSLVIGPLDNHFTTIRRPVTEGGVNGAFACGFHGKVDDLPPGYAHETMLASSAGSVRGAMQAYGDGLMAAGNAHGTGKTRESAAALQAADPGISHLGFYTDNGAYYYYNTENATPSHHAGCGVNHRNGPTPANGCNTWEQTIVDVKHYLKTLEVPAKYVQLDSWWYLKAPDAGCSVWEPRADAFPSGLDPAGVEEWPLVLHNRYFSPDSPYAKNFSFVSENGVMVPTDPDFFPHIMGRAKGWGMITYEQDFLTRTLVSASSLSSNLTLAQTWLGLMNAGAAKLNVTVQYCMAQPQHILQSAAYPRVTNGRASKDYNANRDQWSYFPLNAMLYGAVGLAPFKDNFWSTPVQSANPWGPKCVEYNPELMAVVSTLSTGPVGPADKIGLLNASLVMQTCRADGLLLKPAQPLAPLDVAFKQGFDTSGFTDEQFFPGVWPASTHSAPATGSAPTHHYVVNTLRTEPLSLKPADLGADVTLFAYEYYATQHTPNTPFAVKVVTATTPLTLSPIGNPNVTHGADVPFELYVLVAAPPSPATTWTIVGEANKYVAAAPQRFHSITYGTKGTASADLRGAAGEKVTIMTLAPGATKVGFSECTIGEDGTAKLECGASLSDACTC